ncbi:alkaline phosphatase family protein [Alteromonas sp. AMM-1]|uniref:alkaline phosphatase family protein n=1 Tax=Alteromonas sp. AMM-1 TaxID=3394233 RepID=UPI0039A65DC8
MVTSESVAPEISVLAGHVECRGNTTQEQLQVGKHAFVNLLTFTPEQPFDAEALIAYELQFKHSVQQSNWQHTLSTLLYPNQQTLNFRIPGTLSNVLHGSCRKPHHPAQDSLLRADALVAQEFTKGPQRPDLLIMTGDQIYADDVAGPMLQAILQTIDHYGLFHESLDQAVVGSTQDLIGHPYCYYHRQQILPQVKTNTALSKLFFGAKKKPVFTSVNAQNHLIGLAEVLAMYLLVWSDTPWANVVFNANEVPEQFRSKFLQELDTIAAFAADLVKVRRLLAHIPCYMIFDDHDVTDDWNLTRGWEQEVYGHPLSRRMVGNALAGYWLCQGWGNAPDRFAPLVKQAVENFTPAGLQRHEDFIDALFSWEDWHYGLDTQPPVQVLDTRTRRWRSESSLNKPSGLMDWEALCEFQQQTFGKEAVIVVSAAPIYGVKFIEVIQKLFTLAGKALTVDAENWMAHKGTASVILNIFRHYKTPPHFIILSGDVHYSFVYDVRLRFRRNSPKITQFTCSGIKNTFPNTLIRCLDTLNQWFYSARSPLNIFTRRRNMSVHDRHPDCAPNQALLNRAAIGQLLIDPNCEEVRCLALCSDGETVEFPPESNVDN